MLRGEHLELQRNVTDLARAAADLSDWSSPDTPDHLRRLRDVLCGQLLPHAEAEENVLHPFVDKVLGAQAMSATMVQDHRATHRHIDALAELAADAGTGPPTEAELEALHGHLYGLWAIVRLRMGKEGDCSFRCWTLD